MTHSATIRRWLIFARDCSSNPSHIGLEKLDPGATHGYGKAAGVAETAKQLERLADLQDKVWAEAERSGALVVPPGDRRGR